MRNGPKVLVVGLAVGAVGLATGCSGGADTATERLWVSDVPTSPKEHVTAFVTMRSSEDGYLGAFFQGTMLRGSHDVFQWQDAGKDKARVRFLQDDREVNLRLESCKADTGFHYCLMVYGDPTGAVRYQSRKRWIVKRPGRKRDAAAGLVPRVMLDLAEDDDELAVALDAATTFAEVE